MLLLLTARYYDCFSSYSTLQANLQTKKLSILLYPSEREQADCRNQDGKDAWVEVTFPNSTSSQTKIIVATTNTSYRYQYGIALLYELTYAPSDFDEIVERSYAVYRFCIDSKTICVTSSISIINHVYFNGQGCWSTVKIFYDFWSAEPYFSVLVEPNQCDASKTVRSYLYYQDSYMQYQKVPIYANDTLTDGMHQEYSHMATKIFYQFRSNYADQADVAQFDAFAKYFDAGKRFVLYLVVEYEKSDDHGKRYNVQLQTQIKYYDTPDSFKFGSNLLAVFTNEDNMVVAIDVKTLVSNGIATDQYAFVNIQLLFVGVDATTVYLELEYPIAYFLTKHAFSIRYNGSKMIYGEQLNVAQVFLQFYDSDKRTTNELTQMAHISQTCIDKIYVELNKAGVCFRTLLLTTLKRCDKVATSRIFMQLSSLKDEYDSTTKTAHLAFIGHEPLEDNVKLCYDQSKSVAPVSENAVDPESYEKRVLNFMRAYDRREEYLIWFYTDSELILLNTALIDNYQTLFTIFGVICGLMLITTAILAGVLINKTR